ncbi:hypothetical protein [Thermococcus sp.]
MREKLKVKAAYSMFLFIMFLGVIFITIGTIMATKTGSFLGLSKLQFMELRSKYGIIMMFLILIHLTMNRSIMKKELEILFE